MSEYSGDKSECSSPYLLNNSTLEDNLVAQRALDSNFAEFRGTTAAATAANVASGVGEFRWEVGVTFPRLG